jgi:hypothetical protein
MSASRVRAGVACARFARCIERAQTPLHHLTHRSSRHRCAALACLSTQHRRRSIAEARPSPPAAAACRAPRRRRCAVSRGLPRLRRRPAIRAPAAATGARGGAVAPSPWRVPELRLAVRRSPSQPRPRLGPWAAQMALGTAQSRHEMAARRSHELWRASRCCAAPWPPHPGAGLPSPWRRAAQGSHASAASLLTCSVGIKGAQSSRASLGEYSEAAEEVQQAAAATRIRDRAFHPEAETIAPKHTESSDTVLAAGF